MRQQAPVTYQNRLSAIWISNGSNVYNMGDLDRLMFLPQLNIANSKSKETIPDQYLHAQGHHY